MSAYSGITGDMQGLAALRARPAQPRESRLEEVAGHFEALFTRMMLKTMRESSLNSSLFENNQNSQYTEMFDDQVALQMSRGRGLGLKAMLIRQLEPFADAKPVEQIATSGQYDWRPGNEREFIEGLLPFARRVEEKLGVSHKAVLAQAALESGWGRHALRKADGTNTFNLFGIKADSSWSGETVSVSTLEFADGVGQRATERFRAYQSLGQAANDYAEFIRDNPRYQQAIEHGSDPHAYARELQRAGYATDPDYAKKISQILDGQALRVARVSAVTGSTENRPGAVL